MLISVIVPVYKVEPYIHRCVDSILAQTFTDFELILVDDGSPDNCGIICDEYAAKDRRIHVIHKENGGLSDARNAGIDWAFANSDSEWLTFIDSDDWVHPKYLEIMYNTAVAHRVRIVICKYVETFGEPIYNNGSCSVSEYGPEEFYYYCYGYAITAWIKLYDKQLFSNIRYPYEKLNEDAFVTYKVLFSVERVAFVDAALYAYYINENGIMHCSWSIKRLDELEAFGLQIDYFKNNYYNMAYERAIRAYANVAVKQIEQCKNGNNEYGEKLLCRMLQKHLQKYRRKGFFSYSENAWLFEIAPSKQFEFYKTGKKIQKYLLKKKEKVLKVIQCKNMKG